MRSYKPPICVICGKDINSLKGAMKTAPHIRHTKFSHQECLMKDFQGDRKKVEKYWQPALNFYPNLN